MHQDRASSSDIYLNVIEFTLSGDYIASDESPSIQDLTFQPGSDETSLNFTWLSNVPQAGVLTIADADGESSQFQAVAASLSRRDGFLTNKAVATGLHPGETYSYTVKNGDVEAGPYTFETAPSESQYSFLLVGDPQIGSSGSAANDTAGWQGAIAKSLGTWNDIRFIVSAGDQVEAADNEDH
ncbi:MAG: fibronectin type III domain-containing protein [Clostridiales bacterium]|nr:fibronectin type III domain-containing protein [Clostridiales bacterium]